MTCLSREFHLNPLINTGYNGLILEALGHSTQEGETWLLNPSKCKLYRSSANDAAFQCKAQELIYLSIPSVAFKGGFVGMRQSGCI